MGKASAIHPNHSRPRGSAITTSDLILERHYAALLRFGAKQHVEFAKANSRANRRFGATKAPILPKQKADHEGLLFILERITGLEPATSTLARWRSTK